MTWNIDEISERDQPDNDLYRAWEWAEFAGDERQYWDMEGEEMLPRRSAMAFGWDQLSTVEQAKIQEADQFWRDHPAAFNAFFIDEHARKDRNAELDGWVEDEHGQHPSIPRSHWWWWPLDEPTTGSNAEVN